MLGTQFLGRHLACSSHKSSKMLDNNIDLSAYVCSLRCLYDTDLRDEHAKNSSPNHCKMNELLNGLVLY